jgi:hypothetical protein
VAARSYTGVADYDDYRDAPADRFAGFWDPDEPAPTGGPYAAFPRYPGLLEAAQRPFRAAGLDVPWYISRGNHDGLVQGVAPASEELFRTIAVGCLKVFPNAAFDPKRFEGASDDELFASFGDPDFIRQLIAGGRTVAPDPDRRIISKREYRNVVGTQAPRVRPHAALAAAAVARDGELLRVHAEEGLPLHLARHGGRGRRQHRQPRPPAVPLARPRAAQGQAARPAGRRLRPPHAGDDVQHALGRARRPLRSPRRAGLRPRPRRSTPLHQGFGKRSVRTLFAGTPNLIAYVAGHTHANRVDFLRSRRGRGFWEINTASHIDWPQQSRTIEVMDNRDGTLSLFGTLLDSAAPAAPPPPGNAIGFTPAQLASLGRTLSYNDPQREGLEGSEGDAEKRGRGRDRNVELLVRDPR